ncbi:MAG: ribonuclease P protein component [Prevotella sp.]|nr:ribonuclease P protein component [Prevotella sp.]
MKSERIVSQKLIDELFGGTHSHSQVVYPLRAVYMLTSRPATGSQQPAASSQQPAASSQQPAASSQQPAVSSQQPAAGSRQSAVSVLSSPVQVLISVPKKRFRHAVDRNRVKRQVREAYRHHKAILIEKMACAVCSHSPLGIVSVRGGFPASEGAPSLAIAFIWLSDQMLPSSEVDARIQKLLERIAAHL